MVDRDLLLRKLADLDLYVEQASEFRAVTSDEYRREWKTQRIVVRILGEGLDDFRRFREAVLGWI